MNRSDESPSLFYKPICPPCRWMSLLVVLLSLGFIRRISLGHAEAEEFYARFPERRGQLVLIYGSQAWFQRRVFAAIPMVILQAWCTKLGTIRIRQ